MNEIAHGEDWPRQEPAAAPESYHIEATKSLVDRTLRTLKHDDLLGVFDKQGDCHAGADAPDGLYYQDTRFLSGLKLRIGDKLGAPTAATTFVYHEPLSVMVPREMTTSWREPDDSRAVVSGTAVYSDVRRFQVSTEEAVRPPLRDP